MDIEGLAQALRIISGVEMTEADENLTFEFRRRFNDRLIIEPQRRDDVLAVLSEAELLRPEESLGLAFSSDDSIEIAVKDSSSGRPLRMREDLVLENQAEGLTYNLSRPSVAWTVAYAERVLELPRPLRALAPPPYVLRSAAEATSSIDIWDVLSESTRLTTLRITSTKKRSISEWKVLAESFYFHLGFNLDYALVPSEGLVETSRSRRLQRLRRGSASDIDAPKRNYVAALVRSYQLALSSDSPMLAYLSYYHVAEHWFEDVFLEEIANTVQGTITAPDFSAKRQKDLRKVIKTVSRSLQVRNENVVINEQTALELTLKKYVVLDDLISSIEAFDSTLHEHFRTTAVAFTNGPVVDFQNPDQSAVVKALAKRIYQTRNALVHRKEGERSRFTPFEDDDALRREVPLLRFVAEQIIISTSAIL